MPRGLRPANVQYNIGIERVNLMTYGRVSFPTASRLIYMSSTGFKASGFRNVGSKECRGDVIFANTLFQGSGNFVSAGVIFSSCELVVPVEFNDAIETLRLQAERKESISLVAVEVGRVGRALVCTLALPAYPKFVIGSAYLAASRGIEAGNCYLFRFQPTEQKEALKRAVVEGNLSFNVVVGENGLAVGGKKLASTAVMQPVSSIRLTEAEIRAAEYDMDLNEIYVKGELAGVLSNRFLETSAIEYELVPVGEDDPVFVPKGFASIIEELRKSLMNDATIAMLVADIIPEDQMSKVILVHPANQEIVVGYVRIPLAEKIEIGHELRVRVSEFVDEDAILEDAVEGCVVFSL